MKDNRCLLCGEIIPEGRQLCPTCETRGKAQSVTVKTIQKMTEQQNKAVEEACRQTAKEIFQEVLGFAGSHQEFTIVNDDHRTLLDCDKLFAKIEAFVKKYGVDIGEDQ